MQLEITFSELAGVLADNDRAGSGDRLQPRRQICRMPYGRVFNLSCAGADRADYNFPVLTPTRISMGARPSCCSLLP